MQKREDTIREAPRPVQNKEKLAPISYITLVGGWTFTFQGKSVSLKLGRISGPGHILHCCHWAVNLMVAVNLEGCEMNRIAAVRLDSHIYFSYKEEDRRDVEKPHQLTSIRPQHPLEMAGWSPDPTVLYSSR